MPNEKISLILVLLLAFRIVPAAATPPFAEVESASTDSGTIKIHMRDLDKLVAEIIHFRDPSSKPQSIKRAVVSKTFEAYSLTKPDSRNKWPYLKSRNKDKPKLGGGESYDFFVVQDTIRLEDEMLVVMNSYGGFEFVPYVFAVFDIQGEDLILQGLLDGLFGASMGPMRVKEIIRISGGEYLLHGTTAGRDAGSWGSIWFAYWEKPFHLAKIYRKSYKSEHRGSATKLDYTFDKDKLTLEVIVYGRDFIEVDKDSKWHYTDWVIIEQESVDLMNIVKDLRGTRK